MKVYLAAAYSRRLHMREIAKSLIEAGHSITSQWIWTDWTGIDREATAVPSEHRMEWLSSDLEDIGRCDCIVNFSQMEGMEGGKRGGRHVELGYAMALNKHLVLVGPPEHLFHFHSRIWRISSSESIFDSNLVASMLLSLLSKLERYPKDLPLSQHAISLAPSSPDAKDDPSINFH